MVRLMTTWRSKLSLVAVALAAVAAAARAGWVEDRPDGTTVIHVMVTPDVMPNPTRTDTFARAEMAGIKEFTRRFPQIFAQRYRDKCKANPRKYGNHNWDKVAVELHNFTGLSVSGLEIDLLAIAGGVAPDILYVQFRKSDNYIRNSFIQPLDRPEDNYFTSMTQDEIDFRINPKLWPVLRRKGPDGQVQVWILPYGGALGTVLLYRKDLFDRQGIAYPTVDWDWNNLLDACKKLTDPKEGTYGIQLGKGAYESWFWNNYLWAAGGDVMAYDPKTDRWHCVFDSREAAVALEFYLRMTSEKWTDSEGRTRRGYAYMENDGSVLWDRGQIGMWSTYIDEKVFATINPEVTGMAPMPKGYTGIRAAELNSRGMGLFSEIKSPAVRDAAWEFMRWYDCKEAAGIKTRVMVEGGLGRFLNPKYLRLFGYPEIERLAPKGWTDIFETAIATGRPEPYGRNSNLAYQLVSLPIQEARELMLKDQLPENYQARLDKLQAILHSHNVRANEEMSGIVLPEVRQMRDRTAMVVLAALAITFTLVFRAVFKIFTPPRTYLGKPQSRRSYFRQYMWAYILLVPACGSILLWSYVPLLQGSKMAFQDYKILGQSVWVGVQNFGDLLYDSSWWRAIWNSIRYSTLVMALTFVPPILLAILLQEVPRGSILFRMIYYLPAVITGMVTMLLWKQFYQTSENGVLNRVVLSIPAIGFLAMGVVCFLLPMAFAYRLWHHRSLLASWLFFLAGAALLYTFCSMAKPILVHPGEGFGDVLRGFLPRLFRTTSEPYMWLEDSDTAMLACVIPMVWAGVGPGCLIYLAALKGISDDFYEAADLDGATFIDKILFVVFPILKPLIIINFIGVFIGAWYGATQNILIMTAGGANTKEAGLFIFFKAFMFLQYGPATAAAWMLAFLLIGFTVYQLRILSRLEFRTTGKKE